MRDVLRLERRGMLCADKVVVHSATNKSLDSRAAAIDTAEVCSELSVHLDVHPIVLRFVYPSFPELAQASRLVLLLCARLCALLHWDCRLCRRCSDGQS